MARKKPPAAPDPLAAILAQMDVDRVERQRLQAAIDDQRRLRGVAQCAFARIRNLLVEVDRAKPLTVDDARVIAQELVPALHAVQPALDAAGRAEAIACWPPYGMEGEWLRHVILNGGDAVDVLQPLLLASRGDVLLGAFDLLHDFTWEWSPSSCPPPLPTVEELLDKFNPDETATLETHTDVNAVPVSVPVTSAPVTSAPPAIIPSRLPQAQEDIIFALGRCNSPMTGEALSGVIAYSIETIRHHMPELVRTGKVIKVKGGYQLPAR
jgi:hypothetical protein